MALRRIATTLLVIAATSLVIASAASVSYQAGSKTEPLLRFLDGSREPTIDEAIIAYPMEYSLNSTEANDIIFVGDSTCHDGIDPHRLAGFTSYNLGSVGGIGPYGIALTARAYLKNHPKPRAVVLCVSPFRLDNDPASAGGQLPLRFVATYGPGISGAVPWFDSAAYFAKRGAFGLLSRGATWSEMRGLPLLGMKNETYRSLEAKTVQRRGFFPLPGEHGRRWTVEVAKKNLIHEGWGDGVRQLAAACKESGVPLVVRFGPIWDGVATQRDFSAIDKWSAELKAECPNVRIAQPTIIAWERSLMWDALHLNSAGVDKFMPLVSHDVRPLSVSKPVTSCLSLKLPSA